MTRNKSIGFWCWSGSLSRAGIFNGTFTSADGGKNFAVLTDFRSPFASSYYAPAPRVGALSDDARLTSVCLSRTSGLSREQRGLGRLKLAQSGVRVTCDSDTTFKVKRSTWRGGAYCDGLPRSLLLAVVLSLFFSLYIAIIVDVCCEQRSAINEDALIHSKTFERICQIIVTVIAYIHDYQTVPYLLRFKMRETQIVPDA